MSIIEKLKELPFLTLTKESSSCAIFEFKDYEHFWCFIRGNEITWHDDLSDNWADRNFLSVFENMPDDLKEDIIYSLDYFCEI